MATVPPDRTSPRLDPRYDPVFQRGYTPEQTVEPRLLPSRSDPDRVDPAPTDSAGGAPVADDAAPAPRTPARARTSVLWLVSAALVVAGVVLHFAFGAAGYGADWTVSTEGGAIRFADGRTIEQVLATQLAVAVAPFLVVLGIASGVATLFVSILRPERGTR